MGNDLRTQMKRTEVAEEGAPTEGASDWNEPILPAGQGSGRGRPRTDRGGEAGGPLSGRSSERARSAVPYPYFDETLFCQR